MEIKECNKIYGLYYHDKFTYAFEIKEDVEDYLKSCKNVISCYNPPYDYWSTANDFKIVPIDRTYALGLKIPFYKKNCNQE